jgi:hypothetical protein
VKRILLGSALCVLTFIFPGAADAQFIVSGQVLDADTSTPLPGANVFLANTTKGVASGTDGRFAISNLPALRYKLVVSFIGYQTQMFDVLPGQPFFFKVMLQPANGQLNEVVIRARKSSRAEWLTNFALFKKYFIGLSENAKACRFENPRVLNFDNHNGILTAVSDSSVVIENRGLGYKLSFLVEAYELNTISVHLRYQGQVVFEAMTPEDDEEKMTWARNRLKAYYGSQMHFLRALYNRDLFNEGFYFDLLDRPNGHSAYPHAYEDVRVRSDVHNNKHVKLETLKNYNLILDSARSTPTEPILRFKGELLVQYIHESEEYAYQLRYSGRNQTTGKRVQRSRMVMLGPDALIQSFGELYPEDGVETAGYWSWELVAESLPLDYDPETDKKVLGITGRLTEKTR